MLFARTPEVGKVKTRLIPALGAQGAYQLHCAMLESALGQLKCAGVDEAQLWLTGCISGEDDPIPGDTAGVSLHQQLGEDLGQRMDLAFRHNFARGCDRVILAGSDCPQLNAEHYRQVLGELDNYDAVLVPTVDGGYVAMGLRRHHSSLFTHISWGRSSVYRETEARLADLSWRWHSLDPLVDIDRPEDLVHLAGLDFE